MSSPVWLSFFLPSQFILSCISSHPISLISLYLCCCLKYIHVFRHGVLPLHCKKITKYRHSTIRGEKILVASCISVALFFSLWSSLCIKRILNCKCIGPLWFCLACAYAFISVFNITKNKSLDVQALFLKRLSYLCSWRLLLEQRFQFVFSVSPVRGCICSVSCFTTALCCVDFIHFYMCYMHWSLWLEKVCSTCRQQNIENDALSNQLNWGVRKACDRKNGGWGQSHVRLCSLELHLVTWHVIEIVLHRYSINLLVLPQRQEQNMSLNTQCSLTGHFAHI